MPIRAFSQTCGVVSGAGAKIALTLYYCYVSKVSSRNVRMKANAVPLMLTAIILLPKNTEETGVSLFMRFLLYRHSRETETFFIISHTTPPHLFKTLV